MQNREKTSIEKDAKEALEAVLKELLEIKWLTVSRNTTDSRSPDLKLKVKQEKKEYLLLVEVKSSGEPRMISRVAGQISTWTNRVSGYPVLVAPFISSRGRGMCKELGLGFVDLSGNAYLKFNGILIERWGKESIMNDTRVQKRLFTTKSTWIIRQMLSDPKREWKFDELAEEAGVSLGMAYKAVNKLLSEGFVEKKRGAISLLKGDELLDAWADVYRFEDQTITGYYCPFKEQEKIFQALKNVPAKEYALTLGSAASLVAPFVRSTDVYLYVKEPELIMKTLKLKPVEFGGNVYLVTPADEGVLSDTQEAEGLCLVSNIQLYLDLYNYPMRGREQAEHLREQVLEV